MTTQRLIRKWLVYVLGFLPLWMLDCYILSRYPIYGVTPLLLPLTVAAVATLEGPVGGGGFGMWVGFLWQTTYPVSPSGMIFFLTLFGMFAGIWVQYGLQKGFLGFFISGSALLVAVEALWLLDWFLRGFGDLFLLLSLAGRQTLLTLCYTPVIYLQFQKIFKKVGGNSLS